MYGSLTPKRHVAFCNAPTVQLMDLGVLEARVRERLSKHDCKSARTYKNKRGKRAFHGTKWLKGTQILGLWNKLWASSSCDHVSSSQTLG